MLFTSVRYKLLKTKILRERLLNIAGISRLLSVRILQPNQVVLSTNLFFKFNVSLPLVTGELLQNTVDVTSVTYKLYNSGVRLAARGPNVACDVIFCGPRQALRHSANAWPPNLIFEKLFSKRKKFFKLKLRENSDYRRDEIYLQKRSSSYSVKNAKKSLLKAFVSQKNIYKAMFLKLCAVENCRCAVVCHESF